MVSDPVRARLLDLAAERAVSLAALSRMLGKNASYLQQFIRKGSPRKLEEEDRGKLARFFGVDERELGASEKSRVDDGEGWAPVARLAIGAAAGGGVFNDAGQGGEAGFDTIRFSRRWLRALGLDPSHLAAITVTGDSMEPTLRDGDEILVDQRRAPLCDAIHVVRIEDALLVKRVETGRGGGVRLISDNPAYRPIECTPGEVDVVGRVVWKGGRL